MNQPSQTFLDEADDLLIRIEEIALALVPGRESEDATHELFRAFHTIKGSGAMFGFDAVADFTHHVETVLDQVRDRVLPVTDNLIDLILRSKDQIKALLDASRRGEPAPLDVGAEIVVALQALLPGLSPGDTSHPPAANPEAGPSANVSSEPALERSRPSACTYRIRFQPDPRLMVTGANPIALLDELRDLGTGHIVANTDSVPPLDQIQPDHCYLAWDITLTTEHEVNAIRDVFIFVEDGSNIRIEPIEDNAAGETAAPSSSVDRSASLAGSASANVDPSSGSPNAKVGPLDTSDPLTAARPAKSLSRTSEASASQKAAVNGSTVRVPSERLDRLVSLVGELVMNQSRLTQIAGRAGIPDLSLSIEELERLVANLRDNVLGIRMMPIGATFGRFNRLVHDLSRELGKQIELVTEGAETELDKTVLDRLGDPLVHLIRNSIDHGIESPEQRTQAGKRSTGTLRLAARHEGTHVVILIEDDGRGLDQSAIRAKAVERGLVTANAQLAEKEIFQLIFLPGFSTAREISQVSGRGVGMDVVKRTIESLRGTISVDSTTGCGTTVRLTLPLTLAIIEGLLVDIAGDPFIIPLAAVSENLELSQSERQTNNGRNLVTVRGQLIPYIRLRDQFATGSPELPIEKVVVVSINGQRLGLVVDRVVGSHQTVIQPLGRLYRHLALFSGTTIMGDGRVAMILDPAGIVQKFEEHPRSSTRVNAPRSSASTCSSAVFHETHH